MSSRGWADLRAAAGFLVFSMLLHPAMASVAAQDNPLCNTMSGDSTVATRYAPALLFAPGERYYPTFPFFSAVDDSDHVAGHDLYDDDEIAPLDSHDQISWNRLLSFYDQPTEWRLRDARAATVFFRICTLDEDRTDAFWKILARDPQAWRRLELSRVLARHQDQRMAVIQYFMYYIRDVGLQGHPHDIEMVFVFVPEIVRSRDTVADFRVVVGAAHSNRTPNNVFIDIQPSRDTTQIPVLVELGGHASAPDDQPARTFILGQDVNWYPLDAFGVRDLQAVAGSRYWGNYRSEYTFARSNGSLTLGPKTSSPDTIIGLFEIPGSFRSTRRDYRAYRLLPVQPFKELNDLLKAGEPDSTMLVQSAQRVLGFFDHQLPAPDSARSRVLKRMTYWTRETSPSGRNTVWTHDLYTGDPLSIFKEYLFPPKPFLERFTVGGGLVTQRIYEAQIGTIMSINLWKVHFEGVLEPQFGMYGRLGDDQARLRPMAGLVFQRHYSRIVSWYIRGAWRLDRPVLYHDPGLSEFTFGGGVALQPCLKPGSECLWFARAIRLRTGIQFDLGRRPDLGKGEWEVQLTFQP